MSHDVSGFGSVVTLIASASFPAGFQVTQFSDDTDAIDMPSIQIMDKAMGVNGDLITWSKANPLPLVLGVIPGSDDDINLGILAENNRVGQGKQSTYDDLTLTIIYPDGSGITFSGGKITDAMFGNSISGAGRQKTKIYVFTFQNKVVF